MPNFIMYIWLIKFMGTTMKVTLDHHTRMFLESSSKVLRKAFKKGEIDRGSCTAIAMELLHISSKDIQNESDFMEFDSTLEQLAGSINSRE